MPAPAPAVQPANFCLNPQHDPSQRDGPGGPEVYVMDFDFARDWKPWNPTDQQPWAPQQQQVGGDRAVPAAGAAWAAMGGPQRAAVAAAPVNMPTGECACSLDMEGGTREGVSPSQDP